jgi:hypothetical protein
MVAKSIAKHCMMPLLGLIVLIGSVIAGLQIAFTQPIRLDDVVIVENEWGRIEDITRTYVVVCIWDQRRLIVPVTYFIEKPFQNWTRTTAELLGTVFLYTDYTVPVDEVRKALQGILEDAPKWDKRLCLLQVTNATEKTLDSGRWSVRPMRLTPGTCDARSANNCLPIFRKHTRMPCPGRVPSWKVCRRKRENCPDAA